MRVNLGEEGQVEGGRQLMCIVNYRLSSRSGLQGHSLMTRLAQDAPLLENHCQQMKKKKNLKAQENIYGKFG